VEPEAVVEAPEVEPEAVVEAPEVEPGAVVEAPEVEPGAVVEEASEEKAETPQEVSVESSAEEEVQAQEADASQEGQEAVAVEKEKDEDAEQKEESFEELLEHYDHYRQYRPGDVVKGTVVRVDEEEILLDIGARIEGAVPKTELCDEEGEPTVKYGDKVDVMVCRFDKGAQYIPLSFERARMSKVWDKIEGNAQENELIDGVVVEKVKGGFIVDIGVRAFLPTSLATLRPQKDYQDLLGNSYQFQITKLQRRRGNIILSRKEILKEEYEQNRTELLQTLEEGAVIQGHVKNITDYGAFIDLGGLDGLLHITDMSWGRVNHPKDVLELNREIEVKVLRIDREKEKVSLGLKQITPDPWLSAPEKYPPGTKVNGTVLNLTGFGAFVELEPGVEGLVHVSELSWTKKIRNPAQVLKKGDEIQVIVLGTDVENRRVSLSLRQTEDNPWDTLAERFPVGSRVVGKVRNVTEFGAFVEIEEGIDGLVHVSDFRWGERNADPNESVKKGEEREVVVLAVDSENRKVSLGIKQLVSDPWLEYSNTHKEGEAVKAQVARVTDNGVVVQLAEHVQGFIRHAGLGIERGKKPAEAFEEGQEVTATIMRISHRDRRVDLSIKKFAEDQERESILNYTRGQDDGGATFGDVMKHLVK